MMQNLNTEDIDAVKLFVKDNIVRIIETMLLDLNITENINLSTNTKKKLDELLINFQFSPLFDVLLEELILLRCDSDREPVRNTYYNRDVFTLALDLEIKKEFKQAVEAYNVRLLTHNEDERYASSLMDMQRKISPYDKNLPSKTRKRKRLIKKIGRYIEELNAKSDISIVFKLLRERDILINDHPVKYGQFVRYKMGNIEHFGFIKSIEDDYNITFKPLNPVQCSFLAKTKEVTPWIP